MIKFLKTFMTLVLVAVSGRPAKADIATVAAAYNYISQKWPSTLSPTRNSPDIISMRYLMSMIDEVNVAINGNENSDYSQNPTLTAGIANINAVKNAVDNFIKPDYKFFFTPATDEYTYAFQISAAGTFVIDWADGDVEVVQKDDVNMREISHTYTDAPANTHEIKLAGRAMKYSAGHTAAVRFYDGNHYTNTGDNANKPPYVNPYQLKSMRGCLGCIFSTIADESVAESARQPKFVQTFAHNQTLTSEIPAELFNKITGAPANSMFAGTFTNCKGLTGSIPGNLFNGIDGEPTASMFNGTFQNCASLTGSIPGNLFAGISGKPVDGMFGNTFSGCSNLSGSIPGDLFAGIKGAPASSMFGSTFSGCSRLTGPIPEGLFAGISGAPASSMFGYTFYNCTSLTSIPDALFGDISGAPASGMFNFTFYGCRGLSGEIPENLFGDISGAPAASMFYGTFAYCGSLTGRIPDGLFGDISGAPASQMFLGTFNSCKGLEGGIPENLFGDISGAPALQMFQNTFANCDGLTGESAKVGKPGEKEYLYERWPDTEVTCTGTNTTGACISYSGPSYNCYNGAKSLDDYACIPTNWGGAGTKEPGMCEPDPGQTDDSGGE